MAIINGTSGNNTLIGTASADVITGKAGNDYIDGGAGADIILAGAGKDTVVYQSNDLLLDGGTGFDTLLVTGANQTINLNGSFCNGPLIKGFEMIDIRGSGANTLNVSALGIVLDTFLEKNSATNTYSTLIVRAGQDDVVNKGSGWIEGPAMTINSVVYHVYNQSFVKLLVEDRAPVAHNDVYSINEDTLPTVYGSVLSNDSDVEHDVMTVKLVSGPAHAASFTLNSNGTFSYSPIANYNGDDVFTYRVTDSLGVSATESIATATIHIAPVNDAPVTADHAITAIEDTLYHFSASDFAFTDPNDSPANALKAIVIDSLPSAGVFQLSGVAITAGQSILASDIANMTYQAAADANGAAYANFTFHVQDDGGTANGGVDISSTKTMTIDVASVNDAPVISGSPKVTAVEDTLYHFSASDFAFTDPNDAPANSLKAVVIDSLPPPSAGIFQLNGTAIAAGQSILISDISNMTYQAVANANGAGYANFTFHVQDDGGTANGGVDISSTKTMTIDVASVNDAPYGTDNTISISNVSNHIFSVSDFGFSDPNDNPANSLLAVEITTLPTIGNLIDNGSAVTAGNFISVADINAGKLVFSSVAAGDSAFTFQVQDNGGVANGGVDLAQVANTMSVHITQALQNLTFESSVQTQSANQLLGFNFDLGQVNDPNANGGAITYSISLDPNSVLNSPIEMPTISMSGGTPHFTWVPGTNTPDGSYTFDVMATDSLGATGTESVTVNVHKVFAAGEYGDRVGFSQNSSLTGISNGYTFILEDTNGDGAINAGDHLNWYGLISLGTGFGPGQNGQILTSLADTTKLTYPDGTIISTDPTDPAALYNISAGFDMQNAVFNAPVVFVLDANSVATRTDINLSSTFTTNLLSIKSLQLESYPSSFNSALNTALAFEGATSFRYDLDLSINHAIRNGVDNLSGEVFALTARNLTPGNLGVGTYLISAGTKSPLSDVNLQHVINYPSFSGGFGGMVQYYQSDSASPVLGSTTPGSMTGGPIAAQETPFGNIAKMYSLETPSIISGFDGSQIHSVHLGENTLTVYNLFDVNNGNYAAYIF